jgi:hypothetical protein
MKYFVMIAYSGRFLMVIIWGWIICSNTNFRFGTAIGPTGSGDQEQYINAPLMLGSYYVRFIVVRDTVMIPLALITSLVNYLARTEPS